MDETDWRNEISTKTETLKVKDGDKIVVVFQDEGTKKESVDYGTSIAFRVIVKGETEAKTFYVKANNFDLLGQIKEFGKLTGQTVTISRTGSKRSDTRYKIEKA